MSLFDAGTNLDWYEAFVEETRPQITAYVRNVNNRMDIDPEDVVAQTYLVVWQRLPEVRSLQDPRVWLFKVARGTLRNMSRSVRRRDNLIEKLQSRWIHESGPDPADVVEVLEQLDKAADALAQLPRHHREVLVLFAHHQFTHGEIAEVMGVPPHQVRATLYRARQQLKRLVDYQDPDTRFPNRSLAAVALLVVVVVAGFWTLTRSVDQPNAIACYSDLSLRPEIKATTGATGPLAAEACVRMWEGGILVNPAIVPEGQVPFLTACVTHQGGLAVFPTDDTAVCERLGLFQRDSETEEAEARVRDIYIEIINHMEEGGCQTLEDAKLAIRQILDRGGFTGWTIDVGSPHPDRPCASLAFEPGRSRVLLVPIPDL